MVDLEGGAEWQTITLACTDFKDVEEKPLASWKGIKELRLVDVEHLRGTKGVKPRLIGARWKGSDPEFRNMRWVQ